MPKTHRNDNSPVTASRNSCHLLATYHTVGTMPIPAPRAISSAPPGSPGHDHPVGAFCLQTWVGTERNKTLPEEGRAIAIKGAALGNRFGIVQKKLTSLKVRCI